MSLHAISSTVQDGCPVDLAHGQAIELAAFQEIAHALTSTLPLPDVLEIIADRAVALSGAHHCAVFELDPCDGYLHLRAITRMLPDEAVAVAIKLGHGAAGTAALQREVIFSPDVERQPLPTPEAARPGGIRAILGVPLVSRETVLGALCLYWNRPHAYDEAEVRLLTSLGGHAAIAIQNARLDADRMEQRREAELLSDITQNLCSSLCLASVLRKITEYAQERCASDMAFIAPYDRARRVATIVASVGTRVDVCPGVDVVPGQGIGGKVLETGQPFVTSDYPSDLRFSHDDTLLAEQQGFVAIMAVPILHRGESLGVLWVANRSPRQFTARHQAALSRLAGHAAIAVQNMRVLDDAQRQLREMTALLQITQASTSTLELKPLLKTIAQRTARSLGMERCSISLWRNGHLTPVMSQYADGHHDPTLWEKFKGMAARPVEEVPAHAQAIHLKQPVLVEDAERGELLDRYWVEAFGIRAALVVPVIVKNQVIGTMTVDDARGPRQWSTAQVDLAMTIGAQVALSVENARLYEESQRARADLQGRHAELDTFVYSVSHDLKAPLVTIQGMAGLLLEEYGRQLPEEAARYLGRIQANTQQMERLIVDLLALSRIGREARKPAAVSLAEVVDDVAADLAAAIRDRGIELVRGELPAVWAVRTQIEQVMSNLMGNAVKYLGDTPAGRVEVGAVDQGAFLECHVRDNGIGIDPAYHEQIFEVFQRLKEVEAEGTGVGLAIVKKTIQANGGRIWVESAKGQGATFRFTWPKAEASEIGAGKGR